jgi:hypothetical protein
MLRNFDKLECNRMLKNLSVLIEKKKHVFTSKPLIKLKIKYIFVVRKYYI